MKERPILFKGEMVRAILEGRKTQTRRLMNPQPRRVDGGVPFGDAPAWAHAEPGSMMMRCPYGQRGDRFFVRESFSGPYCMSEVDGLPAMPPSQWPIDTPIWYWADGEPTHGDWTKPKPSIYMPRWASRITLEITGVRVQRLQDISEADAIAEGIFFWEGFHKINSARNPMATGTIYPSIKAAYAGLWDAINGPGSWDENPWVWVIAFNTEKRG
jgi:hypothetical protein